MTISLRLSEQEAALFKHYADMNNMTVSELVRQSVMGRIEDEFDLAAYSKAIEAYRNDPVTYTHDEVLKMLEL